jgi:hypothetical protein
MVIQASLVKETNQTTRFSLRLAHEGRYLYAERANKGLVFRFQLPRTSVFYTEEVESIAELLGVLHSEGPEVLRKRADNDEKIKALWNHLSRMGFFYNQPPQPVVLYELHYV